MAVVTQIQTRRGTAAQWTSANPTLAAGEWGYETDTGKVKIGNGSTAWNSLSYNGAGTVTSITAGTGLSGGTISSSGTIAIDSTVVTLSGSQTLTNKTLTSPVISSISNTGTLTLPTSTDTLVGRATTDTLTNKTLTSPVISTITNTGTLTLPTSTDTLVGRATTDTLTNKTLTNVIYTQALLTPTFSANAYTLVLGDQGDILLASNGGTAGTINIPTNASVAFPTGTQITIIQTGSGQLTIQAATPATTTINSTGATSTAPKLRSQNSSATLIKSATDTWYVIGDIS